MGFVNEESIMRKVESFVKTSKGKASMQAKIDEYSSAGKRKTGGNSKVITKKDMIFAANKIIAQLQAIAHANNLPESVIYHFDNLTCSDIQVLPNGKSVIFIQFGGNLHRDSLYSDGYDGIDNVIALLNNGYHAKNYVYGDWDGHNPTKESILDIRSISGSAHIRSLKDRDGLQFIQKTISDFNKSYGVKLNVTAVAGEDYE